jgi:hypothetical protein
MGKESYEKRWKKMIIKKYKKNKQKRKKEKKKKKKKEKYSKKSQWAKQKGNTLESLRRRRPM